MMGACAICDGVTTFFQKARVLGRYDADYIRCESCGFLQASDPVWLEDAYSDAIVAADLGPVYRCDQFSKIVKTLIHFFFDPNSRFIDYGGGYGLFVRRMRDLGYDFEWFDRYCENLFAQGFAADVDGPRRYELLTAFEVFEHLVDPWTEIQTMARLSDNIFFTTDLLPSPPPPIGKWWYYSPEHGQHIAFYTRKSLEVLAARLNAHLCSNARNVHLITRRRRSEKLFNLITQPRTSEWFHFFWQRPTRLLADFEVAKAELAANLNKTEK